MALRLCAFARDQFRNEETAEDYFWYHLPVGAVAGVMILIMCVTGVLLSYEGLVSAGGAVLVFTGLALAIRRLRAWIARSNVILAPTNEQDANVT